MVNIEIVEYIKKQVAAGISHDVIRNNLTTSGGWLLVDIESAFDALGITTVPVVPMSPQAQPAPQETISQNIEPKYAGFWIRYAAFNVDSLISGSIALAITFTISIVANISLGIQPTTKGGIITAIITLIGVCIVWTYFIILTHIKGATWGKMALNLTVKSEDGNSLSLGKIILRETIGRFVSGITLSIGYIMAGFTTKKQALHDKFAHSVVVYKDPNQKQNPVIIAIIVIILGVLPVIAIIGIFLSVVLASLNTARNKGNDVQVKMIMASSTLDSIIYLQENNTFAGFLTKYQSPACSEQLITNVSEDGSKIAIFGKACSKPKTYFCESLDAQVAHIPPIKEITAEKISKDKIDCEL